VESGRKCFVDIDRNIEYVLGTPIGCQTEAPDHLVVQQEGHISVAIRTDGCARQDAHHVDSRSVEYRRCRNQRPSDGMCRIMPCRVESFEGRCHFRRACFAGGSKGPCIRRTVQDLLPGYWIAFCVVDADILQCAKDHLDE